MRNRFQSAHVTPGGRRPSSWDRTKSVRCWISLVYVCRKPRADGSKAWLGEMCSSKKACSKRKDGIGLMKIRSLVLVQINSVHGKFS